MAITGDGTSLDTAYLVHDYWELKDACGSTYTGNTNNIKYIKLANDIDCNTNAYSSGFEWETINAYYVNGSRVTIRADINLNGKAIKNVMVKNSNILFKGSSSSFKSKIHDGQIRNIFGNTAVNAFDSIELESISTSLNAGGFNDIIFEDCKFNMCATYVEAIKLNKDLIYFSNDSSTPQFANSDFYFDIADANNKYIIRNSYSSSNAQVQSCRFGGKISGTIYEGIKDMNNCVIDVECEDNNSLIVSSSECNNVVYNSSKMYSPTSSTDTNVIAVTTADLKKAKTLTDKGFTVIDINPSASAT